MRCPWCHHRPVDAAARFCSHCGERLQVACQGCGMLNPLSSRYCQQCGMVSEGPGPEASRLVQDLAAPRRLRPGRRAPKLEDAKVFPYLRHFEPPALPESA